MFKSATTSLVTALVMALAIVAASVLSAAPLKLTPANPQPANPKPGLSVSYAFPDRDLRTLGDARIALKTGAKAGTPLTGLDYRDTADGQPTLTSGKALNVAARIRGYVRFKAPGDYEIEFMSNDGVEAKIGGQVVGYYDGRQSCDTTRIVEVSVPQAGWYPVDVLYFQRLGTSCLHMRWGPAGGKRTWTPDAAFGR